MKVTSILMNFFSKQVKLQFSEVQMAFHFNLLRVSKDYKYNITPRTRIQGDFLIEHDSLDNGSIELREDTQWKAASMNFAHILRDVDDQIVTVSLKERTYLTRTVYLMYGETYKELQSLSDEFEESIQRPAENARQYSENDPSCNETSEDDSDHDRNNRNLEYQDTRSRRGRGNRSDDRLRYS